MGGFLKRFITESARLALGVLICTSVVAGVAYAANLVEPTASPPGSNMSAPVNVGSVYQEKTGDVAVDSIGSTGGFCIGASCITSWPAYSTGSTCQLNTMIREDHNPGSMGAGCVPSAAETAAGWTLVSWDYCTTVGSADCRWPYYCVYQQVSCTGNVTIEPGIVTSQTSGSTGGGGGGTGGGVRTVLQ